MVRLLLAEDRQASAIQRINELELADVRDIVVLPGAVDALSALRDAKNAIATSCTIPLAKARIEAADLVVEMTKVKHPMDAGQKGQRGIEW